MIIFGIYSAANIHDVTWGSRPTTDQTSDDKKKDSDKKVAYENFWANYFMVWIVVNVILGWGISFLFWN